MKIYVIDLDLQDHFGLTGLLVHVVILSVEGREVQCITAGTDTDALVCIGAFLYKHTGMCQSRFGTVTMSLDLPETVSVPPLCWQVRLTSW